ncbi:MAG TPA: helical backbone metal receptor [Acidimicrobiia bacterium]|nr:helical backbone metal receptor [Acidimicrobiia bacterium]
MSFPERIVCLTEEPTEVLYALGEEDRIVGITNFTVRPERARKEKPRVSAFTSAHIDKILELSPDLVIGFSDIQADIARDLIKEGVEVWISNHRTVDGILAYVRRLGALVGAAAEADEYAAALGEHVADVSAAAAAWEHRPRVYFEEWHDPLITGIGWVAELIRIAGGEDVFPELSARSLAKDRIIADPAEVAARSPEVVLASWCGKKVQFGHIYGRAGWEDVPAIRQRNVFEIDSSIILQPGPAALTDGVDEIHRLLARTLA